MVSVSLLSGTGFAGEAGSVSGSGTASAGFSAAAFAVWRACFKEAERALHFFASFPDFRNRNIPAVTEIQRMRARAISFWERSFWKKTARRSRERIRIFMLLVNTVFLIRFSQSFLCNVKCPEGISLPRQSPNIHAGMSVWLVARGNKKRGITSGVYFPWCNSSCTASCARGHQLNGSPFSPQSSTFMKPSSAPEGAPLPALALPPSARFPPGT